MYYTDYNYWGMHAGWWVFWLILVFWIYATPYNFPGQRTKKNSPLDILKNRYALGKISKEQYLEHKEILENKPAKDPVKEPK